MTTQRKSKIKPEALGEGAVSLPLANLGLEEAIDSVSEALSEIDCKSVRVVVFEVDNLSWSVETPSPTLLKRGLDLHNLMTDLPLITVSAVGGTCLNCAVEFVLLCDLCFATRDACFCIDEGFVPVFGGIQRAVRTMGLSLAKKLFLMGKLTATEAAFSMVNRVFDSRDAMQDFIKDELVPSALSLSQTAQSMTKRIIEASWDMSLEAGLALEREMFSHAFTTPDKAEGIKAFFEKRKPNFKRRECHEL